MGRGTRSTATTATVREALRRPRSPDAAAAWLPQVDIEDVVLSIRIAAARLARPPADAAEYGRVRESDLARRQGRELMEREDVVRRAVGDDWDGFMERWDVAGVLVRSGIVKN